MIDEICNPMIAYPLLRNLHVSVMCVAKVIRKCVINNCIVFTFGTIHAIIDNSSTGFDTGVAEKIRG